MAPRPHTYYLLEEYFVPLSERPASGGLALGVSIALGLVLSAGILSYALDRIAGDKQSITVKGLAEKTVQADHARWAVVVRGQARTLPEAFADLRANQPKLLAFFKEQGFKDTQLSSGRQTYQVVYKRNEKEQQTAEVEGYVTEQTVLLSSSDVKSVEKAAGQIVMLQESGLPVSVNDPEFLVSKLEEVKMSLIASATRNARDRAAEFAKTGDATVGAMKSATQGSFYILPAQGGGSDDDYGGAYDKSTIDKLARVVVTVQYGIKQ